LKYLLLSGGILIILISVPVALLNGSYSGEGCMKLVDMDRNLLKGAEERESRSTDSYEKDKSKQDVLNYKTYVREGEEKCRNEQSSARMWTVAGVIGAIFGLISTLIGIVGIFVGRKQK
jgi:hypothetical protein